MTAPSLGGCPLISDLWPLSSRCRVSEAFTRSALRPPWRAMASASQLRS